MRFCCTGAGSKSVGAGRCCSLRGLHVCAAFVGLCDGCVCVFVCVGGCCGLMTLGASVIQTEACVTDTSDKSQPLHALFKNIHTKTRLCLKSNTPQKVTVACGSFFFVPGGHAQETISASSASVHLMRPRAPRLAAVRTDSKKKKMRAASPKSGEI